MLEGARRGCWLRVCSPGLTSRSADTFVPPQDPWKRHKLLFSTSSLLPWQEVANNCLQLHLRGGVQGGSP